MNKLPIIFGYLGTLPFFLLMIGSFTIDSAKDAQVWSIMQLTYSAMILSFLGGIHWGQAIPSNNAKQLSFSMFPTIACLFLMIWTFTIDPVTPLIGMSVLFWIIYYADKKLMPTEFIPEGYFRFRSKITAIVTVTLLISVLATIANAG